MKALGGVLCLALTFLFLDCGGEGPTSGSFGSLQELASGTWTLEYFAHDPFRGVLAGAEITLEFRLGDDPGLGGRAGCNYYGARLAAAGNELQITQTLATEMLCSEPDGIMAQESKYLALLATARSFWVKDDHLVLLDGSGAPLLAFTRQ